MHAVEKSTKAGFSHGAEMMMHEEQPWQGVPRGPMEKRPGESVTRVCAQVRSLGQAKPYEIADTAIIMQRFMSFIEGGAQREAH